MSAREDAGRVHQRALAALRGLDGAAIGTLHALCSDILRRFPSEAGVDPGFTVDEGPAAGRLFPAEAERFLRSELGGAGRRADLWRKAIGRRDGIDTILGLASKLSGFSIPAETTTPAASEARARLLPEVDGTLADLADALRREAPYPPKLQRILGASGTLLKALRSGGYDALRSTPAAMSLEELSRQGAFDAGRRTSEDDREAGEAAARRACDLLRLLARVDDAAVSALADTAAPLGAAARERLLATGFVGFDGLLRLTADLLRSRPAVRRAAARRFERLLVDEFQDTDPLQYDILFFLAEQVEGEPATDPYRTRLQAGRLFIVGDPKQSIYRFRGADMASFRRAVAHVEACGGRRLSLTTSFRSPADLLAPVNRLFRGWMGRAGDWQGDYEPPYEEITSARSDPQGGRPRVAIWSVESEGGADAGRAAEADAIAAWIATHASASGGGGLGYRQIAILLRALTHAGLFARAMRRAGIPFVVDGGREFGARVEIGDLLSFLRCVASPNDGPAMLAVLRSPLGAVSDTELARFARAGGRLVDRDPGAAIDASRCPGVARVFGMVEEFRGRSRAWPVDRLVEEALVDPPLALVHASAWDGAQRLANLGKLAALARRHARDGLSLQETIAALEEEFDGARTEGDSPLADESLEAVRILSVHKAKGLEYPVVFVPDLGRGAGGDRGRPEVNVAWRRDGGGLAIRLPDGRSNSAWVSHAIETRRHEQAEEKRVLYVACTRARERLVLVNSSLKGSAPWRERLAALGYRIAPGPAFPPPAILDDGLVEHRVVGRSAAPRFETVAPPLESIARAAAEHRRIVSVAAGRVAQPISWPSGTRVEDRSETDDHLALWPPELHAARAGASPDRGAARLAGLAVHAALVTWDFHDEGALLVAARRAVRRLAADQPGPVAPTTVAAEAACGEILRGFLLSPLRARLANVTILGREVPILHRDSSGRTWTGACDLLFRDADAVVVADYKTDLVANEAAAAAGIYRAQIDVYRRAVRAAFRNQEVRGEIWFLRIGVAVPMPTGAGSDP
jgi:ATP-dependent helicase/nuclease subunit A